MNSLPDVTTFSPMPPSRSEVTAVIGSRYPERGKLSPFLMTHLAQLGHRDTEKSPLFFLGDSGSLHLPWRCQGIPLSRVVLAQYPCAFWRNIACRADVCSIPCQLFYRHVCIPLQVDWQIRIFQVHINVDSVFARFHRLATAFP